MARKILFTDMLLPVTFASLFLLQISASNVQFINQCGYSIELVKTANGENSVQECYLSAGDSCWKSYNGQGMNFKHGWDGQGITLAEFSFNLWNNMDFYDLSVINGFNVPIQIRPGNGGPTVTCNENRCPDAYLFPADNSKTHGTSTGGTFVVTFCP